MSSRTWTLTDLCGNPDDDVFTEQIVIDAAEVGLPNCRVAKRTLRGGLRDGVELLTIDNGRLRVALVPQRGMGVWKAWHGDWQIGWNSPVRGPVHPKFVPLAEPRGLGWLDGFDELLCRCGLFSNGAPDFDARGALLYPLHGRIANQPAHRLIVEADSDAGEIRVTGVVDECRFHFQKLRLSSTLRMRIGEARFEVIDDVTNLSGGPGEMQLLYHVNFGPPLLSPGSRIAAPVKRMMPRDPRSALGVSHWSHYGQPQVAAVEEVFFCQLLADPNGRAETLLATAAGERGISLHFHTRELPCFSLWKNSPPESDGYVTGLEPATNFPNSRSFESSQGRVRRLAAGETARFELALEVHDSTAAVAQAEQRINKLQAAAPPEICEAPLPGWTPTE
ncbi:MAG TPA: aldose 1-epimerase family protein [Pirellulales bacterium]|jgi:hypothetical protein|nr:aldose 1-epimerase family protein [Pirellulales bacterium]